MTAAAVVKVTAAAVVSLKTFSGRVSGEKSFGYDLDFAVEIFQVSMI
jgi:hypothetical protein